MQLGKLLKNINYSCKKDITKLKVTGVTSDSRKVKKGYLFIAIKGLNLDGHDFVDQAIKNQAAAVVLEREVKEKKDFISIKVKYSRKAYGLISANWFGNPQKRLKVIGITGSKGKTTTAYILYQLLKSSRVKTGLITTNEVIIGQRSIDSGLHITSPDVYDFYYYLDLMVKEKFRWAVVEVTSHGLDQGRVEGISFDIGILTNIEKEHLDYHKTFTRYKEAKSKLFQNSKIVVLNKDDKSFKLFYKNLTSAKFNSKIFSYGFNNTSDYQAVNLKIGKSTSFIIKDKKLTHRISSNYLGKYNAYNLLAAIVAARVVKIDWPIIVQGVKILKPIEGRLEVVKNDKGLDIYVDFAHTPSSLKNVLDLLKHIHQKNRLIAVLGCAGERDREKRSKMGAVAVKYCDIAVFTAEDPRSEDVLNIISKMQQGALQAQGKKTNLKSIDVDYKKRKSPGLFLTIPERTEAIYQVLNNIAIKCDTVVFCGKGHEKSMCWKDVEHPWDERRTIKGILSSKEKKSLIILAGGRGKRLKSKIPKVLHKIAGRPMLAYPLETFRKSGFSDIVVVVGFKKDLIKKRFGETINYAYQPLRLGTGDALKWGLEKVNVNIKDVMVVNGDDSCFYNPELIDKIYQSHLRSRAVMTITSLVTDNPFGLGRLVRDNKGELVKIVEERNATDEEKKITEINTGIYLFDKKWASENVAKIKLSQVKEYYIVDLAEIALKENRKVNICRLESNEFWWGINTKNQLNQADIKMRKKVSQEVKN